MLLVNTLPPAADSASVVPPIALVSTLTLLIEPAPDVTVTLIVTRWLREAGLGRAESAETTICEWRSTTLLVSVTTDQWPASEGVPPSHTGVVANAPTTVPPAKSM